MQSFSVVEYFDVLKQHASGFLLVFELVRGQLGLDEPIARLGDGVVSAVAFARHALGCVTVRKELAKICAGILRTTIRAEDQPRLRPPGSQRISEGFADELLAHVIGDLPANDSARVQIDDQAEVYPPLRCSNASHIRDPCHILAQRREDPLKKVRSDRLIVV